MSENTTQQQQTCPAWVWLILLAGLVLLYFIYDHAKSEKAQWIQQDIQSRASQRVHKENTLKNVTVDTDGRDITLSGSVASEDLRQRAALIASATTGARQVSNQLKVAATTTAAKPVSANEIQAQLEPLPETFPPLEEATTIAAATVEPLPDEFPPLEEDTKQSEPAVSTQNEVASQSLEQLDFSNITFKKNSTALTATAQTTLDKAATSLHENPDVSISVVGHTDSSGNPALNLTISKQRAQSVQDYLVSTGIDRARIKSSGFGDQFPIAPNNTSAGRTKNRRIEIKVINGE